ncbi:hypothetical protein V1524DRAFT_243382 [Lipomyces starkeyi]
MSVLESQQLVLQHRYRPTGASANTQSESVSASEFEEDDEADIDPVAVDEDRLVELADDEENDFDNFTSEMQFAMELFQEQRAKGNDKFAEKFMAANASKRTLVQEVKTIQRTMPRTWASWKHPVTMYK